MSELSLCKNKDKLKKQMLSYYNVINKLMKIFYPTLSLKSSQEGGDLNKSNKIGIKYSIIGLISILVPLIVLAIIILFYLFLLGKYTYRYIYSGGSKINTNIYKNLLKRSSLVINTDMCSYEKVDKIVCYKNYLNETNFVEIMSNIKNLFFILLYIHKILTNLFDIISKQGGEFISLKDELDKNFFCAILNYKIEYLNQHEVKKKSSSYLTKSYVYKFHIINKTTGNIYNFELSHGDIKKIFLLKDLSKFNKLLNDDFFTYIYTMIKNTVKNVHDANETNKRSFINKMFSGKKKDNTGINDCFLLFKLLKRIFSNILIKLNSSFDNLKLNRYHHATTMIKNGPKEMVDNLVDDLCRTNYFDNISEKDLNNFNKIDKRIENLNKNI